MLLCSGYSPWPQDVEVVHDAYFHTHREMLDDIWLYLANPEELGLLDEPWIQVSAPSPRLVLDVARRTRTLNAAGSSLSP